MLGAAPKTVVAFKRRWFLLGSPSCRLVTRLLPPFITWHSRPSLTSEAFSGRL